MAEKREQIAAILAASENKLKSAEILLDAGQWADAVSRAYYVVYHAISAVLFSQDLVFSSHAQSIGAFNKQFVKTGIFPKDFGRILVKIQMDRENADYRVSAAISEELARDDVTKAKEILKECQNYLAEHNS
jgi:uncharacterized protein (UPF0332 family)